VITWKSGAGSPTTGSLANAGIATNEAKRILITMCCFSVIEVSLAILIVPHLHLIRSVSGDS
jgi:hypothetical protein